MVQFEKGIGVKKRTRVKVSRGSRNVSFPCFKRQNSKA